MSRYLVVALIFTTLLAGLQACAPTPSPEEGCHFVQNSEKQRISWGGQVPVILYIDSSVPKEYFDAIQEAAKTWNSSIGREVLRIGGWINKASAPQQDGVNVIYSLWTWEDDRSKEQARTTVYWSGDRIYEADIRLNERDFDFFWADIPVAGRVDILSLLIHEFGHVLGLAHSQNPQSVMAESLPSAEKRREIGSDDVKSIRCEY